MIETLKKALSGGTASIPSVPPSGSESPNAPASGGADRLLKKHTELTEGRGAGQEGRKRGPYRKSHPTGEGGVTTTPPSLPPGMALPEVMGSANGLLYTGLAALYDDPDWIISDSVKKELGNICAWMLADDFYKMGGIGKYVVGGVLCLGVFVVQAQKTAGTRRARAKERAELLKRGSQSPTGLMRPVGTTPIKESPTYAGTKNDGRSQGGFIPGPPPVPPPLSS